MLLQILQSLRLWHPPPAQPLTTYPLCSCSKGGMRGHSLNCEDYRMEWKFWGCPSAPEHWVPNWTLLSCDLNSRIQCLRDGRSERSEWMAPWAPGKVWRDGGVGQAVGYDNHMGENRLLSLPQSLQYKFLVWDFVPSWRVRGKMQEGTTLHTKLHWNSAA